MGVWAKTTTTVGLHLQALCMVKIVNTANCKFFVWVDEAEELGYFKNNAAGHGRNARLMEKPKDSVREEVWRARLMDKADCVGSKLRLIKILIGVICLIKLFKMLLYCAKSV